MSKIIIIAPADAKNDVDDAVKILKAAGYEVVVEEPILKSMLHIALGLFGPTAYGFGANYSWALRPEVLPPADKDNEAEKDDTETAGDEFQTPAPEPEPEDLDTDFPFESVTVDGAEVPAALNEGEASELVVTSLEVGPKTKYRLNECSFAFWPAGEEAEITRQVEVTSPAGRVSINVKIVEGAAPQLKIGSNDKHLFTR